MCSVDEAVSMLQQVALWEQLDRQAKRSAQLDSLKILPIMQVACTLAVAEEACEFEHRDLHWGSVNFVLPS